VSLVNVAGQCHWSMLLGQCQWSLLLINLIGQFHWSVLILLFVSDQCPQSVSVYNCLWQKDYYVCGLFLTDFLPSLSACPPPVSCTSFFVICK